MMVDEIKIKKKKKKKTATEDDKQIQVRAQEYSTPTITGSVADMMLEQKGKGLENLDVSDITIPFLQIMQKMSPQYNKKHEKYIKGSDVGQIYNTVTRELFDTIKVIPVEYQKRFLAWEGKKTSEAGSLRGVYRSGDTIVLESKRDSEGDLRTPQGHYLVETAMFYVLQVDDNSPLLKRAVITMTSTQIKKAKRWNYLAAEAKVQHSKTGKFFTPPRYGFYYNLSTTYESNKEGDWYGWVIEQDNLVIDEAHFKQAMLFAKTAADEEINFNQQNNNKTENDEEHF